MKECMIIKDVKIPLPFLWIYAHVIGTDLLYIDTFNFPINIQHIIFSLSLSFYYKHITQLFMFVSLSKCWIGVHIIFLSLFWTIFSHLIIISIPHTQPLTTMIKFDNGNHLETSVSNKILERLKIKNIREMLNLANTYIVNGFMNDVCWHFS